MPPPTTRQGLRRPDRRPEHRGQVRRRPESPSASTSSVDGRLVDPGMCRRRIQRLELAAKARGRPGVQQHPGGSAATAAAPSMSTTGIPRVGRSPIPASRRRRPLATGPAAAPRGEPAVQEAHLGQSGPAQQPPRPGGGAGRGRRRTPRQSSRRRYLLPAKRSAGPPDPAAGADRRRPVGRQGHDRGRRTPRPECARPHTLRIAAGQRPAHVQDHRGRPDAYSEACSSAGSLGTEINQGVEPTLPILRGARPARVVGPEPAVSGRSRGARRADARRVASAGPRRGLPG